MAKSNLTVNKRERIGKTGAVKVRKDDLIPAVIYGKGMETLSVEVTPDDLKKALSTGSGNNTLLEIKIENSEEKPVLSIIKDVQKDPVSGKTKHLDFQFINPDLAISVDVPIEFVGKSQGIKDGGILEEVERFFRIKCLPEQIPDRIEVDITELDIGDSLHVRNLDFADGLEVLNSPDDTVVMVIAPRAAISEAAQVEPGAEGEEAAEGEEETEDTAETEETPEKGGKEE